MDFLLQRLTGDIKDWYNNYFALNMNSYRVLSKPEIQIRSKTLSQMSQRGTSKFDKITVRFFIPKPIGLIELQF
jgi:hypothetical protein